MIKIINKIVILIVALLLLASCSNEISLQEYYVESEGNNDILMVDLPTSLLKFDESISEDSKKALESITKLNVLAFKIKKDNKEDYILEKTKVKKILKNPDYQELIRLTDKRANIIVKFLGSEEAMDEVIVFMNNKEKGFALGRLLGNNMQPEHIMSLFESAKNMNVEGNSLNMIKDFFK